MKYHETPEVYEHKRAVLGALENLSERGAIDLYYGDESQVSREPCLPYGWQFADEAVTMPTEKGRSLNCFALLTRSQQKLIATTEETITASFIFAHLEMLSTNLKKQTVIVLDNARVHTSQLIKDRFRSGSKEAYTPFTCQDMRPI